MKIYETDQGLEIVFNEPTETKKAGADVSDPPDPNMPTYESQLGPRYKKREVPREIGGAVFGDQLPTAGEV